MKILRLQTQGYKRVVAVDITPDDPVVSIRGNNAEGKSSLLDSIKTALGGASAAPIKPIRTGDDFAAIRVELGDGEPAIIVEKYFDEVGEKLKITTAEGFKASQTDVDRLMGRMTFDPLAFARKKDADQTADLLRIAPLKVDLGALEKADAADTLARRDINREGKALVTRRDAINISGIVPERPDRDAIVAALGSAGAVNEALGEERNRRSAILVDANTQRNTASQQREEAARLRIEADRLDGSAALHEERETALRDELRALPDLAEPVDTAKLSADLAKADADLALLARIDERKRLDDEVNVLRARSEAYTLAMKERADQRAKALAEAEMPVPGLSLARRCDVIPNDESTDLIVVYEGEPFAQASSAQQLRVSMRLAMAANPRLRIMIIKDGSLLDDNGLALVRELAGEGDYQVWLESVGQGDGAGIIMEAGAVRGAPEPERLERPKRRKAKADEPQYQDSEHAASVSRATSPIAGDMAQTAFPEPAEPVAPPPPPPARRKASDFRTKPASDLFGGDA